jgi:hypothetical protein
VSGNVTEQWVSDNIRTGRWVSENATNANATDRDWAVGVWERDRWVSGNVKRDRPMGL